MAFVVDSPVRAGAQRSDRASTTPIVSYRRVAPTLVAGFADWELRTRLQEFMARQPPDTCLTVDLPGFRFDHRGQDPQTPASLMKILTGFAALETIGPDTRLTTRALARGPIEDGVLVGNLYLQGGGDPLLVTADRLAGLEDDPAAYTEIGVLADRVVAAGVTRIEGAVVGDESRYDSERYNPLWPSRYASQGQLGPVSALTVNRGVPVDSSTAGDPARNAALAFVQALGERGVDVAGGAATGVTPKGPPPIATVKSAPLTDVVGQMLRSSDNTTAETLLKEIGLRHSGAGTFAAGAAAVDDVLAQFRQGESTPAGRAAPTTGEQFLAVDGSGLAMENTVTCELVGAILSDPAHAEVLEAGLAVAGESGTLKDRWIDTELASRVRAKTGTLRTVQSLAGYVDSGTGARGTAARFVYIVNVGEPAELTLEVIQAQQELADILINYPSSVDIAPLLPAVG